MWTGLMEVRSAPWDNLTTTTLLCLSAWEQRLNTGKCFTTGRKALIGHIYWFACGSDGRVSAYNAGDLSSIPGLGRSPGEENGNRLQSSCLEKSHGRRSLVGYSPWGRKESDTTEWLHFLSLSLSNTSSMFDFKPRTLIWEDVSLVGSWACAQASSSIPLIQATLLSPESTAKHVSLRLGCLECFSPFACLSAFLLVLFRSDPTSERPSQTVLLKITTLFHYFILCLTSFFLLKN